MRTKNVYANASMWVVISPVLFGGFAIRAIEPIESESPKIKSACVSIRGRGWAPPVCCCIGASSGIVCIWSFGANLVRSPFTEPRAEPCQLSLYWNRSSARLSSSKNQIRSYEEYHANLEQ